MPRYRCIAGYGPAFHPQAGDASGTAGVAADRLPEHHGTIFCVALAATVISLIGGPVLTRMGILRGMAGPPMEDTP